MSLTGFNTVEECLNSYFEGHASQQAEPMRRAFMPTAIIEGYRGDTFIRWTLDEYCTNFTGAIPENESARVRMIDSIDIDGRSAMARLTLDHIAITFVDHMVLLQTDTGWKIANKTYNGTIR